MKKRKRTFAEPIVKGKPSAQITDNTAASTGNRGTIHIGKGADDSITTKLELRDSTISINFNSDRKEDETNSRRHNINVRIAKIVALCLGVVAALIMLRIRAGGINTSKQQKK